MKKIQGIILYVGPSMFTGEYVSVVAVGLHRPSANTKTGPMVQAYILPGESHPCEDAHRDVSSVCGTCPLKSSSCYVRVEQGPSIVSKAMGNGDYLSVNVEEAKVLLRGASVRIGAYGDPGAVEPMVWREFMTGKFMHTSYTHFWETRQDLQPFSMASVSSLGDARLAQSMGWRTFRMLKTGEKLDSNEVVCPASTVPYMTCIRCGLCNGGSHGKNVAIPVHGVKYKITNFNKGG